MKKILLVLLILVVATTGIFSARLNDRDALSVGLNLGTDVGVSTRYGYGDFDLITNIGLDVFTLEAIEIEVAGAYHVSTLEVGKADFPITVGLGASAGLDFKSAALDASVLVPIGIEYTFDDFPVTAFIRVAPGVSVMKSTAVNVGPDVKAYVGALWNFEKKGLFN